LHLDFRQAGAFAAGAKQGFPSAQLSAFCFRSRHSVFAESTNDKGDIGHGFISTVVWI
jgi:hypothetical protein